MNKLIKVTLLTTILSTVSVANPVGNGCIGDILSGKGSMEQNIDSLTDKLGLCPFGKIIVSSALKVIVPIAFAQMKTSITRGDSQCCLTQLLLPMLTNCCGRR